MACIIVSSRLFEIAFINVITSASQDIMMLAISFIHAHVVTRLEIGIAEISPPCEIKSRSGDEYGEQWALYWDMLYWGFRPPCLTGRRVLMPKKWRVSLLPRIFIADVRPASSRWEVFIITGWGDPWKSHFSIVISSSYISSSASLFQALMPTCPLISEYASCDVTTISPAWKCSESHCSNASTTCISYHLTTRRISS